MNKPADPRDRPYRHQPSRSSPDPRALSRPPARPVQPRPAPRDPVKTPVAPETPETAFSTVPREDLQSVYGIRTCRAVYEHRPDDIVRIYYRADRLKEVMDILKWAGSHRLIYREQDDEHLNRIAKSVHHEGFVMAVRPRGCLALSRADVTADCSWVVLDRVENPHNVGAIIRSCAFFGVHGIILGETEPGTRLNSAMLRQAEGGAERVKVFGGAELAPTLRLLATGGIRILGFETDGTAKLGINLLPKPAALLFGNEQEGLSDDARRACTRIYTIPGSWPGGSLNVSVSVGVALAELVRP